MNIRKISLSLLLGVVTLCAFTVRADVDPLAEAIMKAYSQALAEDPHDSEVLFRRANIYYNKNDYLKALDDINNALKYIPNGNKELRDRSIRLRSNIYMMLHRYDQALDDLNEQLSTDPENYVAVYQRATAYYELGRYPEAKADFHLLQQRNSRSQEAFFGLARIAVKENNIGLAEELAGKAVEITPSNSQVYMRRAAVRALAGNDQGAVDDYLYAIATDNDNTPKAIYELVNISNRNYPTVIASLSSAIRQAPRNGMYYFIRAMIAQGHYHYTAAIADYDKIIDENLDSYPGLNAALAECYYALGKYDTALLNIDYAISATNENQRYYVTKSDIMRALGEYEDALACADKALEKDPNSNEALITMALDQLDLANVPDASVCLSEASMNAPDDPYLAMLRGWILAEYRGQDDNARSCYERVLDMDIDFDNVKSLRGFALLALDRRDQALKWIENVLADNEDYDGEINYMAACLYAQAGLPDKALDCMELSLDKGYANYYNWTKNSDSSINVAPLRELPRFKQLLDSHAAIFGR